MVSTKGRIDMNQPNVLLMLIDGLRTDALGCYGSTLGATPNLDAFAAQGVRFSHAYCAHSVCMPTRASLFTGRYPHVHGVWANGVPLCKSEVTLPQVLSEAGYATCATGKVHFEPQQPYRGPSPVIEGPYYGFQKVHLSENHIGREYLNFIDRTCPQLAERALKRDRMPAEFHDLQWITDRAIDFIRGQADGEQPFFVYCSFHELIPPCTPPEEYIGHYDPADMPVPRLDARDLDRRPDFYRRAYEGYVRLGRQPDEALLRQHLASYYDQLRFIDHQFGRLLEVLDTTGLAEDTVVVFTADHGLSLNDHWQWRHGPFLFDEVIRVPQVWRGPGLQPAVTEEMVEQVDIMPTILELCRGAGNAAPQQPVGVQGCSFAPLLQGLAGARGRDSVLVQERNAPDLAARGLDPAEIHQVGVRTRDWKLIHYVGHDYGELYDLVNDPGEFDNRWHDADCLPQRREMETLLLQRLAAAEDPLPENHWDY